MSDSRIHNGVPPMIYNAPTQGADDCTTDSGKCGIGGYCGACDKVSQGADARPVAIYQVRYFGSGDWRDVSEAEYQHARMHPDMRDRIVYATRDAAPSEHVATVKNGAVHWLNESALPHGTKIYAASSEPSVQNCGCATCRPITLTDMRMIVCATCGNKRCPHATDHCNACTSSNEPGQPGSSYAASAPMEKT